MVDSVWPEEADCELMPDDTNGEECLMFGSQAPGKKM